MKVSFLAFGLLASLVSAAPALEIRDGPGSVCVHFSGADDDGISQAYFDQCFPLDGSSQAIYNPLSITYISIGTNGPTCTFGGIDGSVTTVHGPALVPVGPPQTQISGSCTQ